MKSKFDLVKLMWWDRKVRSKTRIIDGAPPLTYTSKNAGTLKSYCIYGNTVGGESVGDLETAGEHAGEYKVPVTVSNGADTLTTPIYLPEQIRKVGDEAEYIDFKEQKQYKVRKNLLQNTARTRTINDVTFTVNDDGSVTCNGTASNLTFYKVGDAPINGSYKISGCPKNGSMSRYLLRIIVNSTLKDYGTDIGEGANYNVSLESRCEIRINSGYTCDNLTFYPMIRKADIEDDTYEPYITNTELDVTLPELPTIAGTNTLSVGTQVQPSLVEITGKIKETT